MTTTQKPSFFKHKVFFILMFLLLIFVSYSGAQFVSAQIGVDGLTCSACTRSVELNIRKLDFVKDVQMNLEHTEGTIIFNPDSSVDIGKLAQAVVSAGFSVRYLNATFKTDTTITVSENYCLKYHGATYQFIGIKPTRLTNSFILTFIGKQFLPAKGYKKWSENLKANVSSGKHYYVTQ